MPEPEKTINDYLTDIGQLIIDLPEASYDMFVFVYGDNKVFTVPTDQKHRRDRVLTRSSAMEAKRGWSINRWNNIARKIRHLQEGDTGCQNVQQTLLMKM